MQYFVGVMILGCEALGVISMMTKGLRFWLEAYWMEGGAMDGENDGTPFL